MSGKANIAFAIGVSTASDGGFSERHYGVRPTVTLNSAIELIYDDSTGTYIISE